MREVLSGGLHERLGTEENQLVAGFPQPVAIGQQHANSSRGHEVDLRQVDNRRPLARRRCLRKTLVDVLGRSRVKTTLENHVRDVVGAGESSFSCGGSKRESAVSANVRVSQATHCLSVQLPTLRRLF